MRKWIILAGAVFLAVMIQISGVAAAGYEHEKDCYLQQEARLGANEKQAEGKRDYMTGYTAGNSEKVQ